MTRVGLEKFALSVGVQSSLSQIGRVTVVPPMYCISPPSVERIMNSTSPVGRTSRMTVSAAGSRLVRIIRPAFANDDVFCMSVTRTPNERR